MHDLQNMNKSPSGFLEYIRNELSKKITAISYIIIDSILEKKI